MTALMEWDANIILFFLSTRSDIKKKEKLEKEVHDLKNNLEARQGEIKSKSAEAQTAENMLKDYEKQLRELHVSLIPLPERHKSVLHFVTETHCIKSQGFADLGQDCAEQLNKLRIRQNL